MFEEPAPARKTTAHEIGCDLSTISVAELHERIRLLGAEIQRLEAEVARKQASRNAADSVFNL